MKSNFKYIKKIYSYLVLNIMCRYKGHNNSNVLYHNGFKKGTFNTHKETPLYQRKCKRCNRFNGIKTTL